MPKMNRPPCKTLKGLDGLSSAAVLRCPSCGRRASQSEKCSSGAKLTLENTLRGTGDLGAMCDSVWGLQFEKYPKGAYIELHLAAQSRQLVRLSVQCVKARDFAPPEPLTVQLFPYLDKIGDFKVLTSETKEADTSRVQKAIEEDSMASLRDLEERTCIGRNRVAKIAEGLGWVKSKRGWECKPL